MEFVHGQSLEDIIQQGKLSCRKAIAIILQVADGLCYLENLNLVHRDVKPANIIVNERGLVKLVDFGLVKLTDKNLSLTTVGFMLGTPDYIAPEQIVGEKVDIRSDIYALGCTFYRLITGRRPFPGQNIMDVLQKRLDTVPDPRDIDPTIPENIAKIIAKMTSYYMNQRYDSAQELLTELSIIHSLYVTEF